jgi:riboflavin synthase
MFTGLVEAQGEVTTVAPQPVGVRIGIAAPFAGEVAIGDSVALNGCCLTVVAKTEKSLEFEAGPETLRCTNLGELAPGARLNLERALPAAGRLGGHLVQGHVDGVAVVAAREKQGEWETIRFAAPELTPLLAPKGSVAVDGVSLTVAGVDDEQFSVALIPHTLAVTTLGARAVGDRVNVETDILGKYVWKFLQPILQPILDTARS